MKYFTAFLFEGVNDKDPIHVTHKYLGEVSESLIVELIGVIDQWIAYTDPLLPLPPFPFTKEAFFGENGETRVLLPKQDCTWAFWPELRTLFAPVRADDFPSFQPHVSTNLLRVDALITSFALIGDGKIIKKWMASE